jgi:hypothetical protein
MDTMDTMLNCRPKTALQANPQPRAVCPFPVNEL